MSGTDTNFEPTNVALNEIVAQLTKIRKARRLGAKTFAESIGYGEGDLWRWEKQRSYMNATALSNWATGLGQRLVVVPRDLAAAATSDAGIRAIIDSFVTDLVAEIKSTNL